MDILSKQPTKITPTVPLPASVSLGVKRKDPAIQEERFEFDTKSVFFVGSPAGFFLLLNRSMHYDPLSIILLTPLGILLPRKGRRKPGTSGEDLEPGVAGEAGTYGCMAVDNVYNVLHYSDRTVPSSCFCTAS